MIIYTSTGFLHVFFFFTLVYNIVHQLNEYSSKLYTKLKFYLKYFYKYEELLILTSTKIFTYTSKQYICI